MNSFRVFVAAIALLGAVLLGVTLATDTADLASQPLLLWVLVACVIGGELFPVSFVLRGHEGELAPSTAFAFALMIAFGPGAAIPALAVATLIGDAVVERKPLYRAAFNVGQYTIALYLTGLLLGAITDVPRAPLASFYGTDLPALLLCGGVFYLLNALAVSTVIALRSGYPVVRFFAQDFLLRSSTAGFALGLAPLIVIIGEFSVGMLPLSRSR